MGCGSFCILSPLKFRYRLCPSVTFGTAFILDKCCF
nr:MAG TPA: hypothetical protein [Caudoviricetes sp.]